MSMLERELQRMLNSGASYKSMREMLDEMEAKEKAREEQLRREAEQKARANDAKITAARTKVIEAVANYMIAQGWLNPEDVDEADFAEIENQFKAMEQYTARMFELRKMLSDWDPSDKENKPVKINLPGMNPMMGTVKVTEAPMPTTAYKKQERTDGDILADFLRQLEEGSH